MNGPLDIPLWFAAGGLALTTLLLGSFVIRRIALRLLTGRLEKKTARARAILETARGDDFRSIDRLLFQLGEVGDQRAVEAALETLLDEEQGQGATRLEKLFKSLGLVERYLDQLRNGRRWAERATAARLLGRLGVVEAVPKLVAAMRDPQEDARSVKAAAAQALGEIRAPEAIPLLLGELETRDEWASPRLANVLVSFGETAVPQLVAVLDDEHPVNTRVWAAQILGKIGAASAAGPLMARLGDRSEQVRMSAAEALGAIGDRRATNQLVQVALRDPVPPVRAEAARALGSLGDPTVVDTLVGLLGDPDYWTRLRAIEAIELLEPNDPIALDSALRDPSPEVRKRAAVALQRIGVLDVRVADLAKRDRTAAERAMRTLVEMGRAGLIESILAHLEHPALRVRSRITEILGRVGDPYALPALQPLLADPEWPVRVRAVEAIGRIRPPDGLSLAIPLLSDPEENVRSAAVAAVQSLGIGDDQDGLAAVLRLFDTDNAEVRATVVETIAFLEGDDVDELIQRALLDPNHEVRMRALRAVESRPDAAQVPLLVGQLGDPTFEGRALAVRLLGRIGTEEAIDAVVKNLDTPDRALREALTDVLAPRGVEFLLGVADRSDGEEVELALVWALGKTGAPEAAPHVLERAQHPSAGVRAAVCGAIGKLRVNESVPILEGLARDRSERVRAAAANALGALGRPETIPALVDLARDPDAFVRNRAVLALGRVGRDASPALIELERRGGPPTSEIHRLVAHALAEAPDGFERAVVALSENKTAKQLQRLLTREPDEIGQRFRRLMRIETDDVRSEELSERFVATLRSGRDATERAAAVRGLAALSVDLHRERLFDAVRTDPDAEVRRLALAALLRVEIDDQLARVFAEAIRDPSVEVQIEAVRGIGRTADPAHNERLLEAYVAQNDALSAAVTAALVEANRKRTTELIDELMGRSDVPIQIGAARVLGEIGDPTAIGVLSAWTRDRSEGLRTAAVRALGAIGTGKARSEIAACADDPAEEVRVAVVEALGRRADGELRERLLGMCRDPSVVVRSSLARSIAGRETDLGVSLAERLAQDPEEQIRLDALRALASLEDASALARFEELSRDQTERVRTELANTPIDHPTVAALTTALTERRDAGERRLAASALAKLGALSGDRLDRALADPSPDVRVLAVKTAAGSGDPTIVDKLDRMLRDPDPKVRDAVRRRSIRIVGDEK